jgi:hypothetical protein
MAKTVKSPTGIDKIKKLGNQIAETMDSRKRQAELARIKRSRSVGGVRG